METKQAVDALAGLAQETRIAIFRALVQSAPEGMAAGEIASALAVPAPTLSFHLSQLSNAGLICSERRSRSINYTVDFDGVRQLIAYLLEDCCQGRADLCGEKFAACLAPETESKCAKHS